MGVTTNTFLVVVYACRRRYGLFTEESLNDL